VSPRGVDRRADERTFESEVCSEWPNPPEGKETP
jgi:hypothetical protein